MAQSIWKFQLMLTQAVQELKMPKGAKILHTGLQESIICFWAEVDELAEKENRKFLVVGTGWELPPDRKYIGTVQMPPFVWHVFEHEKKSAALNSDEGK